MEQYSNLNVHGKITQKATQGTTDDDVVKYKTLTDRVPVDVPDPTLSDAGKAIIVNSDGTALEFGEAGKVDDVKIGSTSLVSNKIATIPAATSSAKGVVQTGTGITNSSGTISVTYGNTAGTACQGNDSRLSDARTPLSHTHGNLTNDGKLGTTANKPVVTTTGGVITAGSVTSPIAMSGTSITHETSGAVSSGTLSKGSASKSVSVTVNQWGHVTSLSDQDIEIPESKVTGLSTDLSNINTSISTINGKIPSAASTSNQLADKAFVNSSIGSATANFLGTYNAVSDLGNTQATVDSWSGSEDTAAQTLVAGQIASHLPSGTTVTNNDYVFVAVDQTPTGDAGEDWFWRYKYNGSAWAYEFTLNNSSFTADQWATINSLVTNTSSPKVGVDVKDINAHLADSTIHVTASDKTTWNGKQNAITGAATTITSSNLTANRVLISNSSGKVAASTITTTELGYLDNVTEDIQTQIDTKFDTIAQDATGNYVSSISVDSNDPSTLNVTRATLPAVNDASLYVGGGDGVNSNPVFSANASTDNILWIDGGVGIVTRATGHSSSKVEIKARLKSDGNATYASQNISNVSGRQYAVVPDYNADLSVNVPWTDQSVTSSANHYSPSTQQGAEYSVQAQGGTAQWSLSVLTGLSLHTDGKGHITEIEGTVGKLPANPNTDSKTSSSNSTSKLYLVGATTQSASGQTTYSNSSVYATDGALVADTFNGVGIDVNSSSILIANSAIDASLMIPEDHAYTLGPACEKAVDTSISGSTNNLPTTDAVMTYVSSTLPFAATNVTLADM